MIEEDHENNVDVFKEQPGASDQQDALGSFEKNLPVELSFLIRQQAYCMARMNYLDRQIRELKQETGKHHQQNSSNSSYPLGAAPASAGATTNSRNNITSNNLIKTHHNSNNHHHSALSSDINNTQQQHANQATNPKNGNFVHSDDSGGEFSRATISDDDELSSLLDQIAKSVRPERNLSQSSANLTSHHQHLQHHQHMRTPTQQPATMYASTMLASSTVKAQAPNQPYTIINPGQLHHPHHPHSHQTTAAVPVFVMSSPIAVAHPSSISSTVLPGVHFQPEPRYNQYYEDFYGHPSSPSTTTMNRYQHAGVSRGQHHQFDTSISAIEQLVSQREKKQIKTQLRCADNWLKMRSSTLNNLSSNQFNSSHVGGGTVGSNSEEAALNNSNNINQVEQSVEDSASKVTLQNITNRAEAAEKTSCMIEDS